MNVMQIELIDITINSNTINKKLSVPCITFIFTEVKANLCLYKQKYRGFESQTM
jgi:hypothetical protein